MVVLTIHSFLDYSYHLWAILLFTTAQFYVSRAPDLSERTEAQDDGTRWQVS